ncbi:MAG: amidohydrolase family protein [Bryobacteraceae bacterium]
MNKARAFALVLAIVIGVGLQAAVPSAIAIKDARVVTVSGAELARGTVLLRGGLIQDVGTDLAIPADAWVIDGKGLTVYPGFTDALSTWGIPEAAGAANAAGARGATAAQAPAAQATQPRVHGPEDRPQTYAFERAADLVKPQDHRLESVRSAGFTTAATFPSRGIVTGLGAMVSLGGERGRAMVIDPSIGTQINLRTGGFRAGFPDSLMGVLAYVRQLNLDEQHYRVAEQLYASQETGTRRPEYDHDLEALLKSPRLLLPAVEAQQIDRMLNFGAELKSPYVLYGLHEAYRRIDELKSANLPVLISLKWPNKPKDADPADVPDYRTLEMRDKAPGVPGLLAKAQVKFAFYSDGVDTGPDLKKAIKKAIDAGLSESDAIRALTLSPAEIYGVSNRLGSIDKGKIANLVVIKGDAFDDTGKVEYVFVDGAEMKPPEEPSAAAGGRRRNPEANGSFDQGGEN